LKNRNIYRLFLYIKKLLLFITVFTATLFTAQNVPSYVPTDSLIGWWPLNGNTNDESGIHGIGTNVNFTSNQYGICNSAVEGLTGQ